MVFLHFTVLTQSQVLNYVKVGTMVRVSLEELFVVEADKNLVDRFDFVAVVGITILPIILVIVDLGQSREN